jgi:hypothetical protein
VRQILANFFGTLIPLPVFAIEEPSFFDDILLELFGARHCIWEHLHD